jgi:PAS domain S-box-containing protein
MKDGESYFEDIFERADLLVVGIDLSGRIVFFNPACERLSGYRKEEVLGKLFWEFLPPGEARELQLGMFDEFRAGGTVKSLELPFLDRSGEARRISWSFFVVDDESGQPKTLLGLGGDITARWKEKEALAKRTELFRLLTEHADEIVYRMRLKPEQRFEYVSPSAAAITGYTPEEYYADPYLWLKIVHPDDRHMLEKAAGRGSELETRSILRWIRKDGSMIWTEQRNIPVYDESGELVALEGIARDITEQKRVEESLRESEEKYRTTFEATGTAMFLVERDATISDVNRELEKVFGYSREEVAGKMRYMELLMPEDVEKVKYYSRKLLRGEIQSPLQYEIRARHKTGRAIPAMITVAMLPGIEKSVISLIDISEKKAYELQLEERAEQLRNFLDIAAHELRHPATLLKGYAMTLDVHGKSLYGDTWVGALRAIQEGSDRLVKVVEELLDLSRIERGRFLVERSEVQVADLAERAVEEMRAKGMGRKIMLDLASDLGTTRVDPERLVRLFVILLDNADKYSPPGTPIEVKGERGDREILFSVLDRGVGVPEQDKGRIFERFFQVKDALHHTGPGLGLGLYIGKSIVEAHGGTIWHEPREGGGSIFRFTIPLAG